MKKLAIDVWSDVACPWCYVGKRRLEAALAQFPHEVEVTWRAFELDPSTPKMLDPPYAARLAKKFGTSLPQAEGMLQQMTQVAARDGLDFHFEKARGGNTFDAHRLIHLGAERGVQDAVKERMLAGYFSEGAAIGDPETLVQLATSAGLQEAEVRAVLASDQFAEDVRRDEEEARSRAIRGVPFFAIGDAGVSGAQSPEYLLQALHRAWSQLEAAPQVPEGEVCGPEGCA